MCSPLQYLEFISQFISDYDHLLVIMIISMVISPGDW